jgi:hypothetical protein
MTKKKMESVEPQGLIGLFGHTYVEDGGIWQIQYQFRIVREFPPDRWLVQFYSAWDGTPNCLKAYSTEYLLGEDVRLFPDEESWLEAYRKSSERVSRMMEQKGA